MCVPLCAVPCLRGRGSGIVLIPWGPETPVPLATRADSRGVHTSDF